MGRLRDFSHYLDDRRQVLDRAEGGLVALQEKYETFFSEVMRVYQSELQQLIDLTLADRSALPDDYNADLDQAEKLVGGEFAENLEKLEAERKTLQEEAEKTRAASKKSEHLFRSRNQRLDSGEEALKTRNEALLASIAEFNGRIRSLGGGFGFFLNFFSMRRLAKEKDSLVREHDDLEARIEALRKKWQTVEGGYESEEAEHRARWLEAEEEAAKLSARIEAMKARRDDIVVRSAVELVLSNRRPKPPAEDAGGEPCPRCRMPNPPEYHFCHICAARLKADRPDFAGSVEEIAEINLHHERFAAGMEACQSIIGLVRGMASGVEAFAKSVADVQESENKYPLPKLAIDVPEASRKFGAEFDRLAEFACQNYSLHPQLFADRYAQYFADIFTEDHIKAFFETMGDELTRQAESQWK